MRSTASTRACLMPHSMSTPNPSPPPGCRDLAELGLTATMSDQRCWIRLRLLLVHGHFVGARGLWCKPVSATVRLLFPDCGPTSASGHLAMPRFPPRTPLHDMGSHTTDPGPWRISQALLSLPRVPPQAMTKIRRSRPLLIPVLSPPRRSPAAIIVRIRPTAQRVPAPVESRSIQFELSSN